MTEPTNQPMPENRKCPQCGTPLPEGALAGLCPACLLKQGVAADTAVPDSPKFVPPSIEEIAKLFPQLEIIRLLGKGGMGAVYQARQPSLDRLVALKILPASDGSDPGFAERFNREARALARLSHPNIVGVHEFGQAGNLHYFIMEFVDGVNLRQLQLANRLSPREALQIVPQLCDALQYAHDQGVVHRDIKPENVLMDRKGRVKIADFGLAKMLDQDVEKLRLTGEGHVMGTPHYMSPEQVEHPLEVDHRADIYSLGVVFYEMLTGELPLGRFSPPSSKVQIDIRLDDVVLRALEKEPERRYQHASQVKTAVENIGNTPGASPPMGAASTAALAATLLARDFRLDINHCVRRGWSLVRGDFWPIIGVTAVMLIILSLLNSNHVTPVIALVLSGPLWGGLYLYYFKKARREAVNIDTAFSGFSPSFLHLFLCSLVKFVLTFLGLLCLVLPGIYLIVSWTFALPLVADKKFHFWDAMELSRKMVSKHWWKCFCFLLVLLAINFLGALALGVGLFLTIPITLASIVYAYEDTFGAGYLANVPPPVPAAGAPAAAACGATGPTGTVITPITPVDVPPSSRGGCFRTLAVGCGGIILIVIIIVSVVSLIKWHNRREYFREQQSTMTEYWSPDLHDGEHPDLSKILADAKRLTEKGEYEDARQRYLWYFNHALEYDPAQSGVRLSFVLSDWYELGRRYPRARESMENIRDHDMDQFGQGKGYFALFQEVASLNHYLQNDDRTEDLWESFQDNDHELAEQCFPLVESLLIKHKKYKQCAKYITDPDASFDVILQNWQRLKKFETANAAQREQLKNQLGNNTGNRGVVDAEFPQPPKTADNTFITQTRQLIEVLVATGKSQEAESIHGRAIHALSQSKIDNRESGSLGDPRLDSAFIDAERKIHGEDSLNSSSENIDELPPVVIATEPVSGEREVRPGPLTVQITFSKPMDPNFQGGAQSDWAISTPKTVTGTSYSSDHKTLQIELVLEPGRTYALWVNFNGTVNESLRSEQKLAAGNFVELQKKYLDQAHKSGVQDPQVHELEGQYYDAFQGMHHLGLGVDNGKDFASFRDIGGHPAVPYLLIFHTSDSPAADGSPNNQNDQTK